MVEAGPVTHRECAVLLILVLCGATLRSWGLTRTGLDHFDEGVYAFSALGLADGSQPHRLYPEQIKFSPAVYFGALGLVYGLFGPSDLAAISLNVVLGTLTIPLVWWVGRRWFGPPAAAAAAALLCFSEFHIALCRTALTDVAFACFFVAAIAAVAAAMQRRTFAPTVLAGLLVGLTWNTKYHGWLPLLFALPDLLWWRKDHPQETGRHPLWTWLAIACIAAACYLPWVLFIQSHPGGYAAFSQYQLTNLGIRKMAVGHIFSAWSRNFWRQADQQLFLEGPFSCAAPLLAMLFAGLVCRRSARMSPGYAGTLAIATVSPWWIGGSGTAALICILALPRLFRDRMHVLGRLLFGCLLFWMVCAPLYNPYARLILPFNVATFILAGTWIGRAGSTKQSNGMSARTLVPAIALLAILVFTLSFWKPDPSNPWRPSDSVARAATRMKDLIPVGSRVIVIGEPALAFYLHLEDRPAFERVDVASQIGAIKDPVYLVTGVYVHRAPKPHEMELIQDRLTRVGTFRMDPKDIRVLDDHSPDKARGFRRTPDQTYDLNVYLLHAEP